jgi:general secretion pathway protein J
MNTTHRKHRGMTLMEVMISLAVLSMIVVSVWSSFKGTIDGIATTEDMQKRYSIVRNGLARITSELSMSYLSFNRPLGDPKHYTLLEGRDSFDTDSLTFSTFAHLRIRKDANESDQTVVQYFVMKDPEDSDRSHLYRRETRRLTGDLPERFEDFFPAYVVIEDVVSFDVKYWDNRQFEFIDEWRTMATDMQPDRLPERLKITIGVVDFDGEVVEFTAQAIPMMQERIDLGKAGGP